MYFQGEPNKQIAPKSESPLMEKQSKMSQIQVSTNQEQKLHKQLQSDHNLQHKLSVPINQHQFQKQSKTTTQEFQKKSELQV